MTPADIISRVALDTGINPSLLMSRTRDAWVVAARDRAIATIRHRLPHYTLANIAMWFLDARGRPMHHTSIMAAIKRHKAREATP